MTTPWSHLPNAKHVERVLASLKAHPEKWNAAQEVARSVAGEATYNTALTAARNAARDMAWKGTSEVAWNEAWAAAREAALDATQKGTSEVAWTAVRGAARAAWTVARGPVVAFIAYDDCAYMLDSNVGELKIIATLGDPRAVLLLPACIVFNEINCLTGH